MTSKLLKVQHNYVHLSHLPSSYEEYFILLSSLCLTKVPQTEAYAKRALQKKEELQTAKLGK